MRSIWKRTIFLLLITICFSFYGCSGNETDRKEVNSELPENKDTSSEEVVDTISSTGTNDSNTSDHLEEEKEMSATWKLIKTIQPSEKKFRCRFCNSPLFNIQIITKKVFIQQRNML